MRQEADNPIANGEMLRVLLLADMMRAPRQYDRELNGWSVWKQEAAGMLPPASKNRHTCCRAG
jgi:hypothetical protein